MRAVSKTLKPGDLRENDLTGPLIYFTNDELGILTYEMDIEGGSYMPNEQKEAEIDSPEPAIQAFTATGTRCSDPYHQNNPLARHHPYCFFFWHCSSHAGTYLCFTGNPGPDISGLCLQTESCIFDTILSWPRHLRVPKSPDLEARAGFHPGNTEQSA